MNARETRTPRRPRRLVLQVGLCLAAAAALTAALLPGSGSAQGSEKPRNTQPPTISGSPVLGATQTADPGTWSGTQPITFTYQWRSCNAGGGNCSSIGGATGKTYVTRQSDVGRTLRVRVRASNSAGNETHTSAPTAVITEAPATGCPSGSGPTTVGQLESPARLLVDRSRVSPNPIPLSTGALTVRFHVSACGGRDVAGALVYVTAVPFNQFTIPSEAQTGSDGWATLRMNRLRGFPAADNQSLLVMFVRARKGGEPVLSGISTRRLFSFELNRSARLTAGTQGTEVTAAPKASVVAAACPAGSGPINVNQVTPPARLLVDRFQVVPNPIPLSTSGLTVRFHVSACGGRDVAGALVYVTAVPFNQFAIPSEQQTGGDGWVTMQMDRLSGFPAAKKQTLLVMFVRARKGGEPELSGISTRRLISFRLAK